MLYDQKWDKQLKPLEQWRQTLSESADYIEAHGWCQNASQDYLGRVCVVGAIGRVTAGNPALYNPAHNAFRDHLGLPIAMWNDTPNRTVSEVLKEMRACATEGL